MPPSFDWTYMPTLHTARLDLRAIDHHDRTALFAIYGDPEVMQLSGDPAFPDLTYIDHLLAGVTRLRADQEALV